MDRAFTGTPSRISGITFDTIIGDLVKYHDMAFPKDPEQTGYLPKYGIESRFTAARIGEREERARERERERGREPIESRFTAARIGEREERARA
jgi:glutamate synthase domain-containing protein 2